MSPVRIYNAEGSLLYMSPSRGLFLDHLIRVSMPRAQLIPVDYNQGTGRVQDADKADGIISYEHSL